MRTDSRRLAPGAPSGVIAALLAALALGTPAAAFPPGNGHDAFPPPGAFFPSRGGASPLPDHAGVKGTVPRRAAAEIAVPANVEDEALLGRPVALALDGDRLFIADALDCAIKVFATDGRFLGAFGRKGNGPGELAFPSGVAAAGDAVAVADKDNLRVQIFDGEGRARGGFKLPYAPDRIFDLGGNRLLVTRNPSGRRGERLLHIYDRDGRLLWDGLEARVSSDPVADAFRNMILVCPGEAGDFYLVYRSGEAAIYHFSGSGALAREIRVDGRYAFGSVDMPVGRRSLALTGFCWAATRDRGLFYLAAPLAVGGRDLGPGRTVSILDDRGRLRAEVELPCAVYRFVVGDGRLFAVDDEGALRIFEVGR